MSNRDLLARSLRLFLPISAALTLVLLPMVALYEQSRRETVKARVAALMQAAVVGVEITLGELRADTEVLQAFPSLDELLDTPSPSPEQSRRIAALFEAQMKAHERFKALAVYRRPDRPLVRLSRALDAPPDPLVRRGLAQGETLKPGQIWLSPVQWSASGGAELLVSRPLFSVRGERRGVLLSVVTMAPAARVFNLIANSAPSLQRGYLVSGDGRVINGLAGAAAGLNFAERYPAVWRRIQQQPSGLVEDRNGLFAYLIYPMRHPGRRSRGDGLFIFDSGWSRQHLAVVMQVPPTSLYRTSAFAQPIGQSLVVLLVLLTGAGSIGLARYQQNLAAVREQERRLQRRLQTVVNNAGVGMSLWDPLTGRLLSVNDSLCRFFRRRQSDLLQCTWPQLTHAEDQDADQCLLDQLLRGELDRYQMRKRFLRSDGSVVWGDLVVACSRNDDGTVCDLIGQILDVSELVAKSAYLVAAASAGLVGVWDWDVPSDVLTWDPVMFRLYGLRAEDFQGTREAWERAVHPDDKPFVVQELQAALSGWREYQPRFRVVWPDGSIHYLQARSQTTYGRDGRALRMIGVNYDITEQVEHELQVEQQRLLLATTLEALVDPLLFLTLDNPAPNHWGEPQLRISELNSAAAAFFSRSPPQVMGQPLARVLPESLNGSLHASLLAVVRGAAPFLADAQPVQLREGDDPRSVDLRAVAVRNGLVLSLRDVTERQRAVSNLAASEQRFRLLAENVTDVVYLSEEGRITWMAPGITSALGWQSDQWLSHSLADFCHPDDRAIARSQGDRVEAGERVLFRLRLHDSEGRWHWVEVHAGPIRAADGRHRGVVAAFRVVDAEVEAEAELDRRARTDSLTGLLNRQEILERLQRLALHRRQGDAALAILFCDIDHFKAINDRHGHGGGDTVLKAVAERVRHCTRSGDLVGRFGGDELLVVLPAMPSLEAAMAIADKIHATAAEPLQMPTGTLIPTLSIGVTLINPDEPIDAVVARADQAMYQAKQRGRNCVIAFS